MKLQIMNKEGQSMIAKIGEFLFEKEKKIWQNSTTNCVLGDIFVKFVYVMHCIQ